MVDDFVAYLSKLLGRSVMPDGVLSLTSGQQARVAGWLASRGQAPADLRSRLSVPFAPVALLESAAAASAVNVPPARAISSASVEGVTAAPAVGIDIQRIEELIPREALADPKSSEEITAMFTLREVSYAQSRPDPAETLGGLFAAKEALRKCDAALLARPLLDIEVLPDESGRPMFAGFALSIAHSGGFAIAVAVRGGGVSAATAVPEAAQIAAPALSVPAPKPPILGVAFKVVALLGALIAVAFVLARLGLVSGGR